MNVKTKTSIIIITTLILGIFIGAMLNRALLQRRIGRVFSMRNPATFMDFFHRTLDPSQEQAKKIKTILDKYSDRMIGMRESFLEETQAVSEELDKELDPILTPQQRRRLERNRFRTGEIRRRGKRPLSQKRRGRRPNAEFQMLRKRLALSEQQSSQVMKILQPSMSPRGMMQGQDSLERMLQMWKKREMEKDTAFMKVLTENQKKIYERLQAEKKQRIADIILK